MEKCVLRNFTKFTGKHLCQSLSFNKVAGLRPATLLKKGSGTAVFLWIYEISKNTFFTEHLWTTASHPIKKFIGFNGPICCQVTIAYIFCKKKVASKFTTVPQRYQSIVKNQSLAAFSEKLQLYMGCEFWIHFFYKDPISVVSAIILDHFSCLYATIYPSMLRNVIYRLLNDTWYMSLCWC